MSRPKKPANEPVDAHTRLEIARWPDDAPRGAITSFCREHEISTQTFHRIRRVALNEGQAAALAPKSRAPKTRPSAVSQDTKVLAVNTRAALRDSGLDYGPISVRHKMVAIGFDAPSTATLSRIFADAGVAGPEPKKKPRAALRRFVYPAPNCLWQLDATNIHLAYGRTAVAFQLQDDHSRTEVASLAAFSENADSALEVFMKGIGIYGIPQRLLTDNGAALNSSRQGTVTPLVAYACALGVECITGKPFHPKTQGKNERLHRTLHQFLDAHPLPETLDAAQALIDEFNQYYNHERPHQSLPGHMTPAQAWDTTPVATPPIPRDPDSPLLVDPPTTKTTYKRRNPKAVRFPPREQADRVVAKNGIANHHGSKFNIHRSYGGTTITVIWDENTTAFYDHEGAHLATYPTPRRKCYMSKRAALIIGAEESPMS